MKLSGKNIYDGIYFNKVTGVQCTGCSSNTKRIHHRLLLEYVPETNCLKKNILRKKNYGGAAFW